jgi:hypothetical protein
MLGRVSLRGILTTAAQSAPTREAQELAIALIDEHPRNMLVFLDLMMELGWKPEVAESLARNPHSRVEDWAPVDLTLKVGMIVQVPTYRNRVRTIGQFTEEALLARITKRSGFVRNAVSDSQFGPERLIPLWDLAVLHAS